MRTWQGICLTAVFLVSFSGLTRAQSVLPETEYKKLIKVDEDIQPLGANPFGESISLYNGTLSFEQTDISFSGNGPTIQLSRSLQTTDGLAFALNRQRPFGDWDLDIPRIETLTAGTTTWQVSSGPTAGRCTSFDEPPIVGSTQPGTNSWSPDQWWYGYHLIVPGSGDQPLLARVAANTLTPTMGSQSFPIVTKQNWMIGCGVTADDGGEGFVAVAPDGTQYTFTHLIYRPMSSLTSSIGTAPDVARTANKITPLNSPSNILTRRDALMLATQVKDRFGNTLTYSYDTNGRLSSIVANDGRQVTLQYVGTTPLISTATESSSTSPARTWSYTYDTTTNADLPTLTRVQLPDGSAWTYNLAAFQLAPVVTDGGNCQNDTLPLYSTASVTGSVVHPSGLTGTFTTQGTMRGRSYVPKQCFGLASSGAQAPYTRIPDVYFQLSLTSKVFSGAGIPTQTWSYSYSPANQSWSSDACASGGTCASTVYTDVVDPEGHDVRSTFSNRYDVSEGELLETDYYSGAAGSSLARVETSGYAASTSGPWPTSYGLSLLSRSNTAVLTTLSPESQRVTTQDGDTYTWQAESFNPYGQVTQTKRFNSIAGQSPLEESTSYLNDTHLWVLGLPQQVTNVGTGEAESLNVYDTNDNLQSRARFGQTLMQYTFNTAGQLASFTDANNHTTSLSNYKRGIPQTIGYPDSTSETLSVDDFGQIASITDQAGSTTSYTYDPIGRIASITYPSGDEAAWAPKTFSYALVASAERGIAANHWRRTTTQGSAVSTTYFDTMLRPILSDTGIVGQSSTSTSRVDYDWKGQKTFVSYPAAGSPDITALTTGTHSVYDALERLTDTQQDSELGTLTTHTAYLAGAQQQVTDPKSNITTTAYQVFDQPTYQSVIQVQAPGGITQTISRDIYGNPLSITQSGLYGTETDTVTKTLTYDSFHRLCRTTEPESGSEVTAYDAANNIAWTASGLSITGTGCGQEQVADAAKTNRSYDAMNRVLTLVPPAGTQSTTYTYDPLGNVQTSTSGIATWTGGRNKLAQLTSETLNVTGNGSNVLRYSHDTNGHVATISYPDGLVVNYAPDALGRPTQAGSFASGVSYYPDGDVEHFTFGNGADYLVQKNARQLLSNFSYAQGSTLNLSEDFVYDGNGNITNINDLAGGPRTKSFGYDALNRLTSAQAAGLWGTETYSYDPLNNIRSRVSDGQTYSYNYDATNRLASITNGASTAFSFGYDPRGNVTAKNSTSLVFDQKNQLTQIPGLDSYAYDASGRRVLKSPVSGNPTYYFYTQDGQLLYQFEANTTKSTDYIFLGKKLIARNEGYTTTIIGGIDGINIDGSGNATISGWACSTGIVTPITVEVFVGGPSGGGGTRIVTATANQASEPAVATACQTSGTTYRFSIPLTTAIRSQYAGALIYMYGDSPVGNGNLVLGGAGEFQVPAAPTAPAAPASATATVAGNLASITVAWSSASTATNYVLQQRYNGGAWTQVLSANATTYTATNPADGSYAYQVQACNANGCSAFTPSNTVSVAHIPAAPASISAPASSTGAIGISWAATTYATGYTLEQSINGGAFGAIYSGTATSDSFSVGATGSYTYRVKACNANGCGGYATSGAVAVTIPPASAPSLSVPANSNTGSYTVTWTTVAGATSYIFQEQVNGGAWTVVQNANLTSWSTSGRGNATYGYVVQACNAGGCGPLSNVGSIVVALIPAVPTGLHIAANNPQKGTASIAWDAMPLATSYTVQTTTPKTDPLGGGETTTANTTSTTAGGIWTGSSGEVIFSVRSCNAVGCSAYSNSVSAPIQSR